MRILFACCVFPPEIAPSAVMAEELARGLAARGHEVELLTAFPSRPEGVFRPGFGVGLWSRKTVDRYTLLRVRSVSMGRERRYARRILENVSFGLSSALAVLLSRKPDLVLMETWPLAASLLVLASCRLRGVPVLNYVKDLFPEAIRSAGLIDPRGSLYRSLLALDRAACCAADRVIAISDDMARQIVETRKLLAGRVEVIPDWINLAGIAPARDEAQVWRRAQGLEQRQFVALFAGTVGHASGASVLAGVAEELLGNPRISLICVGDGPLKADLEAEKRKRGLDNLTFLPFQPRETISAMHSAADVCLLPTAAGMGASSVPSKLITYFASGRPVIAMANAGSDLAAMVEANAVGWVTPPGDVEAFARAIEEAAALGRSKLDEMGATARVLAETKHSLDAAIARFDDLIERVTLERTGAAAHG